jgi:hypothetical protein
MKKKMPYFRLHIFLEIRTVYATTWEKKCGGARETTDDSKIRRMMIVKVIRPQMTAKYGA